MNCASLRRTMYAYYLKDMVFVSIWNKPYVKIGIYILIGILVLAFFVVPHVILKKCDSSVRTKFSTDMKYILIWSSKTSKKHLHYTKAPIYSTGQREFIKQNCEFINCYVTYNSTLLLGEDKNFDAVIFDINEIKDFEKPNDFKLTRSRHQKYVFKSLEPSEKYPVCHPFFDNFFNWTWTYKLKSDIEHPFLTIHKSNGEMIGPKRNMNWTEKMEHTFKYNKVIKSKSKAVAWILTNCRLKNKYRDRIEELESELKGYKYKLDIYGPCGQNKCPDGPITKCYRMIEQKYYFILMVENYVSEDYVSEDIVHILGHIIIPIVFGGANYSSFLSPGSYLNLNAFDIKKTGAVINYLIQNHNMYEYFFDWKKYYSYKVRPKSYICNLCAKLNKELSYASNSAYDNLRRWWNPEFEYNDYCHQKNYNLYINED